MTTMRHGYKIVMESPRGLLRSPFAPETAALVYVPGQWAEPRYGCGPLFCYASVDQADGLTEAMSVYLGVNRQLLKIWFCEYEPWPDKLRRGRTFCCNIEPVWGWSSNGERLYLSDICAPMLRGALHGTRLCRRIRLIREIQPENEQ